jgi:hypothetical protein
MADAATDFLNRKRSQQAARPRAGAPMTLPPSPYDRYGVGPQGNGQQPMGMQRAGAVDNGMNQRPLMSGKYTGQNPDGSVQPTMPTEMRVAVNGQPYAVDQGETLVIDAGTTQDYGGPENLDKFIQSNRGHAKQYFSGGIPSKPERIDPPGTIAQPNSVPPLAPYGQFERPYEANMSMLRKVEQGKVPQMFIGGIGGMGGIRQDGQGLDQGIDLTKGIKSAAQAQQQPSTPAPSTPSMNLNIKAPTLAPIQAQQGIEPVATPTPQMNIQAPKLPVIQAQQATATGVPMAIGNPRYNSAGQQIGTWDAASIAAAQAQNNPTKAATPGATATGTSPVLSQSKLDEMTLNNYMSRLGGMEESDRAGEAQRLLQQGVGPEAARGIQAVSDTSRREALGTAAAQYATSAAQRETDQANTNRTFAQNAQEWNSQEGQRAANDAATGMDFATWQKAHPTLTKADYDNAKSITYDQTQWNQGQLRTSAAGTALADFVKLNPDLKDWKSSPEATSDLKTLYNEGGGAAKLGDFNTWADQTYGAATNPENTNPILQEKRIIDQIPGLTPAQKDDYLSIVTQATLNPGMLSVSDGYMVYKSDGTPANSMNFPSEAAATAWLTSNPTPGAVVKASGIKSFSLAGSTNSTITGSSDSTSITDVASAVSNWGSATQDQRNQYWPKMSLSQKWDAYSSTIPKQLLAADTQNAIYTDWANNNYGDGSHLQQVYGENGAPQPSQFDDKSGAKLATQSQLDVLQAQRPNWHPNPDVAYDTDGNPHLSTAQEILYQNFLKTPAGTQSSGVPVTREMWVNLNMPTGSDNNQRTIGTGVSTTDDTPGIPRQNVVITPIGG